MRPLAVLIAILFGSSVAISFGLCATAVVFLMLRDETPRIAEELPTLLRGCAIFLGLATVSGLCLYATLKSLRWRYLAHGAMWLAFGLCAVYYWPR